MDDDEVTEDADDHTMHGESVIRHSSPHRQRPAAQQLVMEHHRVLRAARRDDPSRQGRDQGRNQGCLRLRGWLEYIGADDLSEEVPQAGLRAIRPVLSEAPEILSMPRYLPLLAETAICLGVCGEIPEALAVINRARPVCTENLIRID